MVWTAWTVGMERAVGALAPLAGWNTVPVAPGELLGNELPSPSLVLLGDEALELEPAQAWQALRGRRCLVLVSPMRASAGPVKRWREAGFRDIASGATLPDRLGTARRRVETGRVRWLVEPDDWLRAPGSGLRAPGSGLRAPGQDRTRQPVERRTMA